MKRIALLTAILLLFSLCLSGCQTNRLTMIPSDVSKIEDFKCVVCIGETEEFVVEGEQAKNLYQYIYDTAHRSEQTDALLAKSSVDYLTDYIELSFQTDDPVAFYGVFDVFPDDYMIFVPSISMSAMDYYLSPAGTYQAVEEMLRDMPR